MKNVLAIVLPAALLLTTACDATNESIDSIDSVISYDWGLYNIICDEIDSYYIQGKSEDEIAKTLQSRIDLYVAENYK